MRIIFFKLCDLMSNVTFTLQGALGQSNPEIIEMKNDVLYRPLPHISKDRANLKEDGKKVIVDLNAAYEEYVEKNNSLAV